MKTSIRKWHFIILTMLLLSIAYFFYQNVLHIGAEFNTWYSYDDLEANYLDKNEEMVELNKLFAGIVTIDKHVHIRYGKRRNQLEIAIDISDTNDYWHRIDYKEWVIDSRLKKKDDAISQISQVLDCTTEELLELLNKFKDVNCISVGYPRHDGNSKGIHLWYRRCSAFYNFHFGYDIFPEPISDGMKAWVKHHHQKIYNDSTVFRFTE